MTKSGMTSSEIREAFLKYFEKNQHARVASSSLIPENDPTLLFANAGMNQFKNVFLGHEKRPYTRAVTSQKCVRAGGKHNDLDNVGFTARHHTFFEMLGNFSFGDYFKKDAIHYAWELLTKDLAIPKEKLYVTVFETDDEAADIWHKQEGVPRDRIFRLGEKDNFWRMGDTGPCGPCSEIFFDHGPLAGKESDPFKGIVAGEDRFVEIWNLVFMQFFEKSPGQLEPLPKPSVDTGSGLERVVAALQGRYNNYNTDLFSNVIQSACSKLGWDLEELIQAEMQFRKDPDLKKAAGRTQSQLRDDLAALRVLADHTRSTSFLIADGALPSNEGRGYVLRRIMRRAIRYGRKLSSDYSFLPLMSEALIQQMRVAYPELHQRKDHILNSIREEESRFLQTLDQGTQILNDEIRKLENKGQKTLPGEVVFKLYDTYGFPTDLTALIAAEKNMSADEAGFEKLMQEAKTKAKASWKGKGIAANEAHVISISQKIKEVNNATVFTGYSKLQDQGRIIGLSNGSEEVQELNQGQTGFVFLNQTPFYAEGGGQVGDQGKMKNATGSADVHNCTKSFDMHVHHVEVTQGSLKVGQDVTATVDESERRNTMSNHSATHLMHTALRKVLGNHVTQAGSLVDATRTRFDFTHGKALTRGEIESIENLVNAEIAKAHDVSAEVMPHKAALAKGAMALFGEKYGDEVRVLTIGDFSCELCGGTHVKNTAQIRYFKIASESGVSAGVRRIEAITGDRAIQFANKSIAELDRVLEELKLSRAFTYVNRDSHDGIVDQIQNLKKEISHLEKEIKKGKSSHVNVDQLVSKAMTFDSKSGPARLIFADTDLDDRDVIAQTADQMRDKIQKGIVVVVGKGENSHPILVTVSKDLTGEFSAGNILKELAQTMGGKGGGRPDFAQGAVPDRSQITQALSKLKELAKLT